MRQITEVLAILEDEEPDCYIVIIRCEDTPSGEYETFGSRPDDPYGAGPYMRQCIAAWEAGNLEPGMPDFSQCRRVPLAEVQQRRAQREAEIRAQCIQAIQQEDPAARDDPSLSMDELREALITLRQQRQQADVRNTLNRLRSP